MKKSGLTFENLLLDSIHNNNIKTPVTQNLDFTKNDLERINNTIKKAIDHRLLRNKAATVSKEKSFAAFILSVREISSFTLAKMANIFNIEETIYNSIEKGTFHISALPIDSIVNILITINLKLKDFIRMLNNDAIVINDGMKGLKAVARSPHKVGSDDRGKHISLGIDAVMKELSKKNNNYKINTDQYKDLIQQIEKSLTELNEFDLLK